MPNIPNIHMKNGNKEEKLAKEKQIYPKQSRLLFKHFCLQPFSPKDSVSLVFT